MYHVRDAHQHHKDQDNEDWQKQRDVLRSKIDGKSLEQAQQFKYLESVLNDEGTGEKDIHKNDSAGEGCF